MLREMVWDLDHLEPNLRSASLRAPGRASLKMRRSSSLLHETRMHRSRGGTPGMRTKTLRSVSSERTRRANAPSLPQSIVTKLVALGKQRMPCCAAMFPRVSLACRTRSRT